MVLDRCRVVVDVCTRGLGIPAKHVTTIHVPKILHEFCPVILVHTIQRIVAFVAEVAVGRAGVVTSDRVLVDKSTLENFAVGDTGPAKRAGLGFDMR